ncbi:MAG: HAD family hydrolase [Candidatus Rokubacteria bacterium]|nr:HAD family hydrolase [Candidatus Rokubacteria bacterium]MBI3827745.1 HAD family hydrolase [Candidatus Rokubacteria bacterium]
MGYINHPSRLRLLPRSGAAIRRLNEAGIAAVVATNQAGIARGYFSQDVLDAVHEALVEQLKAEGAHLDGIYVCVHHPTEGVAPYRADCQCRKPRPGLLVSAATDLDLDLARSVVVGDKASDLAVARAVGARAVLVKTGYGLGEWEYRRRHFTVAPDHVAEDLLDAVDWMIAGTTA